MWGNDDFWFGCEEWYQNGELHRADGPAITDNKGLKQWYKNGVLIYSREASQLTTKTTIKKVIAPVVVKPKVKSSITACLFSMVLWCFLLAIPMCLLGIFIAIWIPRFIDFGIAISLMCPALFMPLFMCAVIASEKKSM